MSGYTIYQIDAFTTEILKGNPAGVVLGAETLTNEQMQAIARELNNSETAFILPPDGPDYDIQVRFFTPTTEVPSCGHATIAANYVWAIENELGDTTIRQKIQIGILDIDVEKVDADRRYRIYMNQGRPVFLDKIEDSARRQLLKALGLKQKDLTPGIPIQIVSTGHSKVMVPLRSRQRLHSLNPDMDKLIDLSSHIECNGYFLFTLDSNEPEILTHARMFAPAIGIPEDPVTGNGNGPMGAYLVRYKLVEHDGQKLEFISKQGEAINREGLARISILIDGNDAVRVKVGGDATVFFKTTFTVN